MKIMSLMVIDKVRRFMGCGKWKLEDRSSSFVDVLLLMSHVRGGKVKKNLKMKLLETIEEKSGFEVGDSYYWY